VGKAPFWLGIPHFKRIATIVSNVISMDDHTQKGSSSTLSVRDRRYAIRYPFAADAELLDLESGARIVGVTSDISMGGCFVCTSKPLPLKTRLRANFRFKDQIVEALGVVRIVKLRIGMGVEFLDVEPPYDEVLSRWIAQLQKSR
jgi:PilZ domain-containing protein